jgi:hypothetical protein
MQIDLDKLFEYVIAVILRQNGYRVPVPGQYLEGRGGKHQIDVIGLYPFSAPFIFPIRIVAEAKCYGEGKIGINFIRNLHSEIIDLEQTLPKMRALNVQNGWEPNQSCSYHGALFSTIPFTKDATEYANAYCIDLIHFNNKIGGICFTDYLKELIKILDQCLEMGSPYFSEKNKVDKHVFKELANKKKYGDLSFEEKKVFLDLIEWILTKCIYKPGCRPDLFELKPFSDELFQKRLGSIDGHAVVFEMSDDQFQKIRKATLKRFVRRSEGGGNPFYPPADEEHGPNKEMDKEGALNYLSPKKIKSEEGNVEIVFYGEMDGNPVELRSKIDNSVYESLASVKAPKKIVIPIDVGCFYYGLW